MVEKTAWQPNDEAVKKLHEEFTKAFVEGVPKDYDSYLLEYAKVAAFLQDESACVAQLKRLNELVEEEAKKCGLDLDSTSPYGYLQHKKVLRNVLERELAKFDFQPEFAKATGMLEPTDFRGAVKEGYILKDPGASYTHGEFTHAIQWLMIAWQQQDSSFLKMPVIDLFKKLGEDSSVVSHMSKEENLWDLLVDQNPDCHSFQSPEWLHSAIINNSELPVLKKLVEERMNKRMYGLFGAATASPDKVHKEYEQSPKSDALLLPKKK